MNVQSTNAENVVETTEQAKQAYATPELTVHGKVEDLTQQPIGNSGGISNGGGGGQMASDRNIKEAFAKIDPKIILERVALLPITSWNYKSQDRSIRHIGPMAQDFAAAFAVGEDDRHINMVDASGIALASIQALHQLVQQQAEQIAELRDQVKAMQAETTIA